MMDQYNNMKQVNDRNVNFIYVKMLAAKHNGGDPHTGLQNEQQIHRAD